MADNGLDEARLFEGIGAQIEKKFGHLGEKVVDENVLVIRRGFDEVKSLDPENLSDDGRRGRQGPDHPRAARP